MQIGVAFIVNGVEREAITVSLGRETLLADLQKLSGTVREVADMLDVINEEPKILDMPIELFLATIRAALGQMDPHDAPIATLRAPPPPPPPVEEAPEVKEEPVFGPLTQEEDDVPETDVEGPDLKKQKTVDLTTP